MPQLVELPDGQSVEFPDGATSAQMTAALRKHFPQHFQGESGKQKAESRNAVALPASSYQWQRAGAPVVGQPTVPAEASALGQLPGVLAQEGMEIVRGGANVLTAGARTVDELGNRINTALGWQPGSALSRGAAQVDRALADVAPVAEEEQTFGTDVAQGVGNLGAMLAGGAAARLAGAGPKVAAAVGAGMGFGAEFDDAMKASLARGDDPDLAFQKALAYGTAAMGIEYAGGAGRVLRKWFGNLRPEQVAGRLTAWGVSQEVAKSAAAGFAEEASQRLVQNLIVNEGAQPFEGVVREGAVGALLQGAAAGPAAGRGGGKAESRKQKAEMPTADAFPPGDIRSPQGLDLPVNPPPASPVAVFRGPNGENIEVELGGAPLEQAQAAIFRQQPGSEFLGVKAESGKQKVEIADEAVPTPATAELRTGGESNATTQEGQTLLDQITTETRSAQSPEGTQRRETTAASAPNTTPAEAAADAQMNSALQWAEQNRLAEEAARKRADKYGETPMVLALRDTSGKTWFGMPGEIHAQVAVRAGLQPGEVYDRGHVRLTDEKYFPHGGSEGADLRQWQESETRRKAAPAPPFPAPPADALGQPGSMPGVAGAGSTSSSVGLRDSVVDQLPPPTQSEVSVAGEAAARRAELLANPEAGLGQTMPAFGVTPMDQFRAVSTTEARRARSQEGTQAQAKPGAGAADSRKPGKSSPLPNAGAQESIARQATESKERDQRLEARAKRLARGVTTYRVFDRETELLPQADLLAWIKDNGGMLSKSAAKRLWSKEKFTANASLWDSVPQLRRPHHNAIYKETGQPPDRVAQAAYEAGMLPEPAVEALKYGIEQASGGRAGRKANAEREAEYYQGLVREQEAWQKATEKGEIRANADELQVGDVLDVEGERVEVVGKDPETGEVTLKDGRKFGVQKLQDGSSIAVEKWTQPEATGAMDWPEAEDVTQRREDAKAQESKAIWQMTKAEFGNMVSDAGGSWPALYRKLGVWVEGADNFNLNPHRKAVDRALREGLPVPPEVAAEYPDLATDKPTAQKAKYERQIRRTGVIYDEETGSTTRVLASEVIEGKFDVVTTANGTRTTVNDVTSPLSLTEAQDLAIQHALGRAGQIPIPEKSGTVATPSRPAAAPSEQYVGGGDVPLPHKFKQGDKVRAGSGAFERDAVVNGNGPWRPGQEPTYFIQTNLGEVLAKESELSKAPAAPKLTAKAIEGINRKINELLDIRQGRPLTGEESQQLASLERQLGQQDLAVKVEGPSYAAGESPAQLRAKADQMDALRIKTQERAYASKARRQELLAEAAEYAKQAKAARVRAAEVEKAKPDLIAKLEGLKQAGGGELFSTIPGLDPATFRAMRNTALDVAIGAIKAGLAIREAAEAGWQNLKAALDKLGLKYDAAQLRAEFVQALTESDARVGLSARGTGILGDESLSAEMRSGVNPAYARRPQEEDAAFARRIVQSIGGPEAAAREWLAGNFRTEPEAVQTLLGIETQRQLANTERAARSRGDVAAADGIVALQQALAEADMQRATDLGQGVAAFRMHYANWTPAAWVKDFREKVAGIAAERVDRARVEGRGSSVEGKTEATPTGIAQGVAEGVADKIEAEGNPKLAKTIREHWGKRPVGDTVERVPTTLEERLAKVGTKNPKATARKVQGFYEKEVRDWRRKHKIPEFDAETEREIIREANRIEQLPEDSIQRREAAIQLHDRIARMKGFEWWELPLDFWYANILSGFTTHARNILGNSVNLGAESAVMMARNPTAIPQILEALGRALPKSAREAGNVLRTGRDTAGREHASKFDAPGVLERVANPVASKLLLPWKLVGRTLRAEDLAAFYPLQEARAAVLARHAAAKDGVPIWKRSQVARKILGWTADAQARAVAKARGEGLAPGTLLFKRRVSELLENQRPEVLMRNAREFAFDGTFNNDPYGLIGAVADGIKNASVREPALKFVVPFTRIVANVSNSMLNWTPVGFWRAGRAKGYKLLLGKESNTGKLFGREVTDPQAIGDEFTRATVGTAALLGVAAAAAASIYDRDPKFAVTGGGPSDPDQKALLRQTGWIPYSVKVGDRYVSYQNTMAGLGLGIIGAYMDAVRYRNLDEQDALNRAAFALGSGFNVVLNSSFLSGLASLFNQASETGTKHPVKGVPATAIRTATSLAVPNFVKQVDQLFDPTRYSSDDVRGMMLGQIPFARRNGQPDLNVFGEPVLSPLSKTFWSQAQGDLLTRTLAGRRLWPSVPAESGLTADEHYEVMRLRGPLLRAALAERLGEITSLPRADAQAVVSQVSAEQTRAAMQALGLDNVAKVRREVQRGARK